LNWDIYYIRFPGIQDGDIVFFDEMRAFANNSLTDVNNYKIFIDKYVNIDSFIDYLMIESWGTLIPPSPLFSFHPMRPALLLSRCVHCFHESTKPRLVHEQCGSVSIEGCLISPHTPPVHGVGR